MFSCFMYYILGLLHQIFIFLGNLIHSDAGYNYYKIPVANNTRMLEGAVSDTCQAAGFEAVCSGPFGCQYSSNHCLVTTLSTECDHHMRPLSVDICGITAATECPDLQGMFSYRSNYTLGECGVLGDGWCVAGNAYVSGDPMFFAYCAAPK